jgi:predicted DNA-binding transcriptional regulator YafY
LAVRKRAKKKKKSVLILKRSLLFRLVRVVQEIKKGTYPSTAALAEVLEVSERTVDRYIETLRDDFGAPIAYSRKHKGYYFQESWVFPFPVLTEGEVFSLFLSLNLFKQFEGTPLEKPLRNLAKKLEDLFYEQTELTPKELEMMLSPFVIFVKPKVRIDEVFAKVFEAIVTRRWIKIRYFSFSSEEERERVVEPYHLYNFQGVWYFFGFCHLRQEIRDFALDRVAEVEVLPETFSLPQGFDPQDYLFRGFRMYRDHLEQVRIRFDPYQARWIKERIWHPSQKLEELPDGSVIMEISAHPEEAKRWIIGYGPHAEVLEPASLREEVRREVEEMLRLYSNDR